ncbi:unnamed protein product [Closterium sp. NIES-53]
MAWPARDRDELGLRTRERNLRIRTEGRREEGPRRRAAAEEEDLHPPRRHPLERLICAASVLVAEKGYITVGGLAVKQAIIDTGAHPVLIGKRLAQQLRLDRPERQIEEGLLLMTAKGGGTNWERLDEEWRQRDRHRQRWGESGRLRELHLDVGVFHKPIVLLELFAGICTGLAAVLKAGLRVEKYIYVENDEVVNCMAWHHVKKLEDRYPSQLHAGVVEKGAEWYPCNVVGKPRQAWPTLVAHDQAKGFKIEGAREGPGMVYDSLKGVWEEPTALERELAMGFMAGATASGDVTEQQRKRALGNAMDLNALHWLVGVLQRHLEKKRLERRRDHAARVNPRTERDDRKQWGAERFLELLEEEAREERQKGVPVERRTRSYAEGDEAPGRYPDQDEEEEDVEEGGEPEMDWDSEEREDPTDAWIPDPDEVFLGPRRAY